jgi:hypothetical protein
MWKVVVDIAIAIATMLQILIWLYLENKIKKTT